MLTQHFKRLIAHKLCKQLQAERRKHTNKQTSDDVQEGPGSNEATIMLCNEGSDQISATNTTQIKD